MFFVASLLPLRLYCKISTVRQVCCILCVCATVHHSVCWIQLPHDLLHIQSNRAFKCSTSRFHIYFRSINSKIKTAKNFDVFLHVNSFFFSSLLALLFSKERTENSSSSQVSDGFPFIKFSFRYNEFTQSFFFSFTQSNQLHKTWYFRRVRSLFLFHFKKLDITHTYIHARSHNMHL